MTCRPKGARGQMRRAYRRKGRLKGWPSRRSIAIDILQKRQVTDDVDTHLVRTERASDEWYFGHHRGTSFPVCCLCGCRMLNSNHKPAELVANATADFCTLVPHRTCFLADNSDADCDRGIPRSARLRKNVR